MKKINFAFYNGDFVEDSQLSLPISDLGLQRGYSVFDFFLVKNANPLFIDSHLSRLFNSIRLFNIPIEFTVEALKLIIVELIKKNSLLDSSIKIIITGGTSHDDFCIQKSTIVILNKTYNFQIVKEHRLGGRLITENYMRDIPEVKSTNYSKALSLQLKMKDTRAVDVLYHTNEIISETSRTNIFMVKDNIIYTPKNNILKGITRERIINLNLENDIVETDITLTELANANEVFITSTTKMVMPIIQIDDIIISDGEVGHISKALLQRLAVDYQIQL